LRISGGLFISALFKIIWPDQKSIGKQTAAVLSVSVVLGVLITIIDMIVQYGVDFLVK